MDDIDYKQRYEVTHQGNRAWVLGWLQITNNLSRTHMYVK